MPIHAVSKKKKIFFFARRVGWSSRVGPGWVFVFPGNARRGPAGFDRATRTAMPSVGTDERAKNCFYLEIRACLNWTPTTASPGKPKPPAKISFGTTERCACVSTHARHLNLSLVSVLLHTGFGLYPRHSWLEYEAVREIGTAEFRKNFTGNSFILFNQDSTLQRELR